MYAGFPPGATLPTHPSRPPTLLAPPTPALFWRVIYTLLSIMFPGAIFSSFRRFVLGQIIRAIEATAEEEERGIYRTAEPSGGETRVGKKKRDPCCEKHAFQLERSAVHMLEERVKDTLSKVGCRLVC